MNRIVWAEIPVADLERAISFYQAVVNCEIDRQEQDGKAIGVIPDSATLLVAANEISVNSGILVYISVEKRIRDAVKQVEDHGGKILQRIHTIEPYGFRAIVQDSEGNRIALHSTSDS
jgi:predicted enzyme related to lactoylglutathione lyase